MASQTISRAQSVLGALRTGHVVAKAGTAKAAAPLMRPSQIAVFGPARAVAVSTRKASTVTAAAANGTGLPIDLRGEGCVERAMAAASSVSLNAI